MADTKISALPASTTPLAGTEVLPIVQSGATKQVSVANLTAGRDVSAASITLNGATVTGVTNSKGKSAGNNVAYYAEQSSNTSVNYTSNAFYASAPHFTMRWYGTTYGGLYDVGGSQIALNATNGLQLQKGGTTVLSIGTSDATVSVGNLVIGTSGKGIDFSAAGGTVLDDYEEGSWTPVVTGSTSAGTGTYTIQRATYTKIGRTVAFTIQIVWSAHTGTGTMRVTLPFTAATPAAGGVYYPFSVVGSALTAPASTTIAAMGFSTLSYMNIYSVSLTPVNASALAMDTSAGFYINGTYEV